MTRLHDQPVAPVQPLFEGPLDLIGDVHGEWGALQRLLAALGYARDGAHVEGRRLVFVGDLCDRGPDSPAVMMFARELVAAGRAQCVLGNHELNLLRAERKHGNGWFFDEHPDHASRPFAHCRRAGPRERDAIRIFCSQLPAALVGTDLRVAHAAWREDAIDALRAATPASLLDLYGRFEADAARAIGSELDARAAREKAQWRERLYDPAAAVPLLEHAALHDAGSQMGNPLRVLTSGVERPARQPFFANGKWRMVERVGWWNEYREQVPVVIGHYWRWLTPDGARRYGDGSADALCGTQPLRWLGPAAGVFCVDYSVGARFREVLDGFAPSEFTRLCALRWPERELVDEFGVRRATEAA
jgi:hypothetical protein